MANTLVTTDPPDYRTLRNLVNRAFTPRAVTRLSHRVTQITQELLDAVKATGHMDVVSDIAFPLPAKIIAEMLGVPAEDWDIFQRWARFSGGRENEGSREPALMPAAIEEVLRYLPPVWFLFRRTTQDVELGGQHIPANQMVLAWTASANRDAAQFPQPDQFNIQREPNRHLAFGHGIHFCVGAPLARLEAKIVLPMMLEQLKDLKRVEGVPVGIHTGIVFVIGNLPITFQPA